MHGVRIGVRVYFGDSYWHIDALSIIVLVHAARNTPLVLLLFSKQLVPAFPSIMLASKSRNKRIVFKMAHQEVYFYYVYLLNCKICVQDAIVIRVRLYSTTRVRLTREPLETRY